MRILVIEDDLSIAMGLEMILENAGHSVIGPFGRLDQALEAARNRQMDVALLDVDLRGQASFPVADVLTARAIPYAFLSGYGRESLPARFDSHCVLSKPFQPDSLVTVIQAIGP